jgi:hypothetical protein
VKRKDLVQNFSQYTGKCARIDGEDIIAGNQKYHENIQDAEACQLLCAETCNPDECTCKGF